MKQFILFICVMFAFAASAQTVRAKVLTPDLYVHEYAGIATDTVGIGNTTWAETFEINKCDGIFYNARVKVSDRSTGGGVATIVVQGKHFDTDNYSTLKTVTWTGVGSTDTIAPFTEVTTKQYYRYIKILVTRTAGLAKVDYVKLSLKKN